MKKLIPYLLLVSCLHAQVTINTITGSATPSGAAAGVLGGTYPSPTFGTFASSALLTALSDETGTGVAVFNTSPSLVTPNVGVATATSINGNTITAGTGTLTLGSVTLNAGAGGTLGSNAFNSTAIPAAANPTGTVGPTATNGSAGTYMRSDGAPAINLTSAYTWTGLHVFNGTSGLGVGGAPSTAPNSFDTLVYMTRTTAPASGTVGMLDYHYYAFTPVDATTVQTAGLFDMQLNGADVIGAGHSIALIARCSDTSSNVSAQHSGFEAKRQAFGASDNGQAGWFDGLYNMASATNRWNTAMMATGEFFNGSPSTPITTGGFVGLHVQTPGFGITEGDSTKFWSLIGDTAMQLQTGGRIASYSGATPTYGSLAPSYISLRHDGTDGNVESGAGNIQMKPVGGYTLFTGGCVPVANGGNLGLGPNNLWLLAATSGSFTGKITTYNNVATAGWGVPGIQGAGRVTAQTGANTSVATYTVGAADGSFIISGNVLVTTSTTHAFTMTCSYTDEGNTARVITFTFSNVGGTLLTSIANTGGAVPYEGVPLHIRAKASTAITIKTAGTFTSVTYNAEGVIQQIN